MGRTCIVDGCLSGRKSDLRQRQLLGLRPPSIFQIPKRDDVRRKWSTVININLQPNNHICELHFHDRHIKSKDVTVMPDGTVTIIPCIHSSLIDGAVPTLIPEKSESAEPTRTATPIEIEVMDEDLTSTGMGLSTSSVECLPSVPLVGTDSEFVQSVVPAIEMNEDSITDSDQNRLHHEVEGNRPESEPMTDVAVPDADTFNVNDSLQGLTVTPLPKGCSWMRDNAGQFTLVRLDLNTWKPILHAKINADMSITSCAPEGGRPFNLDTTVRSIDDVLDIVRVIDRQKLCVGTGVPNESRAPQCVVILETAECPKNVREPRCNNCRRLRLRLQSQLRRPKVDNQTKYFKACRKLDLQRLKIRRLQEKKEKLKKLIQRTKQQCAEAKESAIMDAIAELPDVQQEAVKACFSAAKVVNTKRRRYTLEWVYECILMRIKNSKLYEHLRSHNILPLPCKDTINSYIKRMHSAYGFQTAVFDCLKLKASGMEAVDKRGIRANPSCTASNVVPLAF